MNLEQKLLNLGDNFRPITARWEVTSHCNASCSYCFVRDNTTTDLPTESMNAILDKLDKSSVLSLYITGGEPFCRSDILEILERVMKSRFLLLSIFTNGTMVAPNHTRFLAANAKSISFFQMSAFSHHPDINDSYFAIPGALDSIVSLGSKLAKAGIPVYISINLMPLNINSIEETKDFFLSKGMRPILSLPKFISANHPGAIPPEATSYDFFRRCFELWNDFESQAMRDYMQCCTDGSGGSESLCSGLTTSIMIDYQGDIYPCALLRHHKIGNIFDKKSVTEILRDNKEYRYLRSIKLADLHQCAMCRFSKFCHKCIGARSLENGDITKPCPQACNLAQALYDVCMQKRPLK